MSHPKYSVIVPVFDRPQEADELLSSLTQQTFRDFEVLIIEDGSTKTSEKVYEKYASQLSIHYFFKPNSGPGPSRNFGFEKANGEYFVVFDSDCIIPPTYFESVDKALTSSHLDAWGGPDRGKEDFSPIQQAMACTMSSVLTTGGIRGGTAKGFQPRSFNMGISREVFQKTNGFQFDRLAEDIEFSIRIMKAGFKIGLIPDAFVYHKRRTDLRQFFLQVSNFGRGRVLVGRKHREAIKITHWFPAFFVFGLVMLLVLLVFNRLLGSFILTGYLLYLLAIAAETLIETRSMLVACLSIPSALVQLTGYGIGFIKEILKTTHR